MKTLTDIIRDLRTLQQAQRSGSPAKIRVTWKKVKDDRTLATVATRTERTQQQPRQPAPPVRRVASILEQLAKKAESK